MGEWELAYNDTPTYTTDMHICICVPISVTKNLRFTSGLERPFIDILSVGLGDIGSGQIGSSQQTFHGCGNEIPFDDGDLGED